MKCLICKKSETVKFLDDWITESMGANEKAMQRIQEFR